MESGQVLSVESTCKFSRRSEKGIGSFQRGWAKERPQTGGQARGISEKNLKNPLETLAAQGEMLVMNQVDTERSQVSVSCPRKESEDTRLYTSLAMTDQER